jgi:hypothetical protein
MRKMLRRLLGKDEAPALDLAGDDWTPVPPSETGSAPDWGEWLQQHDPPLQPQLATPPPAPISLDVASMASLPVLGRARIRTPMPERRWREVLSDLAEHLSDEELLIIRKQLAE